MPLDTFPDELVVMLDVLLGPQLRLASAADDSGRPAVGAAGVEPRTGDDVASRLAESDLEALRALHALLDLGPGGLTAADGDDDLSALTHLGERRDDDADGWDGIDDVHERESGESWDDWDEASAPRVVLGRIEQVCRLTPAAHAAPLLSVVASLAWWCGDGARAGVAVDQALALEPDHRLSRLVRQSLDHGIRPSRCA